MNPLQLIHIEGIMPGGTTKPLNILTLDIDNEVSKYIMKTFSEKNILENASVAKEIFVSDLAKQFDLNCPNYGIINFDHTEFNEVYPAERIKILDKGFKFCSKFIEQTAIFNPNVSNGFLKDYEIANIFAFDVLIYNVDRGGEHHKPNLLINDEELILIDHELCLPFINNNDMVLNYETNLRNYQFNKHILIKHLKSLKDKGNIFDDFLEMLKVLNLNSLSVTFDNMDKFDIPYFDREKFINYFAWAKQNFAIFERYLKGMIK